MDKLLIEKIHTDAKVPERTNPTDAGLDVCFHNIQSIYVHAGGNGEAKLEATAFKRRFVDNTLTLSYLERALIGTGIKIAVPDGYEVQVRPRSGLALKQGFEVVNSPGTIDSGYRGEVCVILKNGSRADQQISLGDRIAQLVVNKVELPEIEVVPTLPPSTRGAAGFGSSGK